MRTSALTGALLAALALASSAASTPAQDSARRLAEILRAGAPALRASTRAPLLGGQLRSLNDELKTLVAEKSVAAAAARPVSAETEALLAELKRGPFDGRSVADKALKIADDAQALLRSGSPAKGDARDFHPSFPPPAPAALAALRKRADAMAAVMGRADFDGARPVAASGPAAAAVPLPRPRLIARQARPAYSAQAAYYQGALNPFLKAEHRRPLGIDGVPGAATMKAVALFQEQMGLPKTGVIDRATEAALFSDFQVRRHLPISGVLDERTANALRTRRMAAASAKHVYFEGADGDFEPKPGAQTIKNVVATVYTPYLAKTKKQKKMEGAPIDRHDQAVCTLERYLEGACPYVSVAVDPRLKVPNGTPLLIPEISRMAGRTVHFRIVDTGSKKRFKGTGHVDVATDSNQYAGYGRRISGQRLTLVLPEGLHPAELF